MSSTRTTPSSITELLQKRKIDWAAVDNQVRIHDGEFDDCWDEFEWQSFEHCLFKRMRASPCPLDDAIDLFCYPPLSASSVMEGQLGRLKDDVYQRFSSESVIALLQGIHKQFGLLHPRNSRRHFLEACQTFFMLDAATKLFEKFKVVVFEITRLLDIQRETPNFWALRVLEISKAMNDEGLHDWTEHYLLASLSEHLKETDEDGNTCVNHLLGQDDKFQDFARIFATCMEAISIPNHQGTLPLHNIFGAASRISDVAAGSSSLHFCKSMIEVFPDAVLYPSREFHGRTPFHNILPGSLSAAKLVLSILPNHVVVWFLAGIELAIEKHPNVLNMVDDYGLTPLHYLVSCGIKLATSPDAPVDPLVSRFVSTLVSPKSARIRSNLGRLPLHTALDLDLFGFVDDLCDAAPETLERRDPETFLYPFLMASNNVSTSYELLRMAPHLVATASDAEPATTTKEHTIIAAPKLEAHERHQAKVDDDEEKQPHKLIAQREEEREKYNAERDTGAEDTRQVKRPRTSVHY